MYTLIILEEADREFQAAAVWYEEKSTGLGLRFIAVIKRKLEIIREHPERNTRRKGNFGKLLLKSFLTLLSILFTKRKEL